MAIPRESLDLIKEFEGYLRRVPGTDMVKPYRCPARVATIGYGSTFYEGRVPVRMSDPAIDRPRALELLAYEIERICEPAVDRYVTRKIHPLMRGALVSFAFNCGTGALKSSTLLKRVNSGDWDDVPRQLAKWRMGGGVVLRGLVRRRAAEAAMFMDGVRRMRAGEVFDEGAGADGKRDATPEPAAPSRQTSLLARFWQWVRGN